ncbi:MAG: glycosyltransferase family 39 protein, partial [Armatimonadetes bacterium]|nr:glycosyltransferase family 39 protein [Armatimonadota bacterium]
MDSPAGHDAPRLRLAAPSWPGGLVLAVLLIVGVNALCRNVSSLDSFHTLPTAMSLLRHHDLDLDEYPRAHLIDYRIDRANGDVYNRYPLGVSLWAVPFVWVADKVVGVAWGDDLEAMMKRVPPVPLEVFPAAFAVALATILLMILVRREASAGTAWLLGMTFAFATPAWSSASRGLWQHGPEVMCLAAALLCLERAEAQPRWLAGAGVCLGTAYWMRPLAALVIAVLLVYAVGRHWLAAVCMVGGLAVALAPFVWVSWATFGQPLPPYYTQHLQPRPDLGAFLGLWVSPSRGLLVYSPVLLLSFWGMVLRWREGRRRWLDGSLMAILFL